MALHDMTPNFVALAEHWVQVSREIAAHGPSSPRALLEHEAWGRLLIRHGWLTPDGTRATGAGTIASPAEVLPILRGEYDNTESSPRQVKTRRRKPR